MTWGQQPVVVVTGASSGIGKATVEAFARAGRNVAATMRTPANAPAFDAPAERIRVFRLDVTDEASIAAGIEQIEREAGPIDVLVNNAGFGLVGPLEATAPGEIRRVIETNVIGLIAVTRAVLGPMRRRRSGVIINVGSVGGRLTFPYYSVYHATKHAVEGLSESLAFELKEFGIRVKIIEPGPIKTEFYGRGESRSQDAGRPWEEAETEAIDRYPDRAELIRAYRARWHEMVPGAIDGTVAILEELAAAETPLHAITNFAADTFAETRRRFGFFERFQSIVVSGEIGIVKPDARIFRHLAERQGFDLARAVLIDDSAANCAAARELGMGVVHFKEPGQARRELIEQGFPLRPAA